MKFLSGLFILVGLLTLAAFPVAAQDISLPDVSYKGWNLNGNVSEPVDIRIRMFNAGNMTAENLGCIVSGSTTPGGLEFESVMNSFSTLEPGRYNWGLYTFRAKAVGQYAVMCLWNYPTFPRPAFTVFEVNIAP